MTTTIETSAPGKALRALKLSGMLATIDARLAQARAGELGHIEFLQVLCEDEISRRETMSITRRLRKARFDEQVTLEGFDFTASPKLPAAQIRDLAALRWLHAAESVILYGRYPRFEPLASMFPQVRTLLLSMRRRSFGCCGLRGPSAAGEFAPEFKVLAVGLLQGCP